MPEPIESSKTADDIRAEMKKIAKGRVDSGRPLGGEVAQQMARKVLTKHKIGWK